MNKNVSTGAFSLKQKIINSLSHIQQPSIPPKHTVRVDKLERQENFGEQLIEDIRVNTEIIKQIQWMDKEIQQLQLNIAHLAQQYEFVRQLSRDSEQLIEQVGQNSRDFLGQRDIKSRLLTHLQSVHKKAQSIDSFQVLGASNTPITHQ